MLLPVLPHVRSLWISKDLPGISKEEPSVLWRNVCLCTSAVCRLSPPPWLWEPSSTLEASTDRAEYSKLAPGANKWCKGQRRSMPTSFVAPHCGCRAHTFFNEKSHCEAVWKTSVCDVQYDVLSRWTAVIFSWRFLILEIAFSWEEVSFLLVMKAFQIAKDEADDELHVYCEFSKDDGATEIGFHILSRAPIDVLAYTLDCHFNKMRTDALICESEFPDSLIGPFVKLEGWYIPTQYVGLVALWCPSVLPVAASAICRMDEYNLCGR